MTPSKIRFLKGWLHSSAGRALSEKFPAKYYYLVFILDGGDSENPLVEADKESPTPFCKCEKKVGPYVRVYLAPQQFLSVCRKCGEAWMFTAEHDSRRWKVTWNDPRGCGCPPAGKERGLKSQKKNSVKKD